jgi:hypothetical protein
MVPAGLLDQARRLLREAGVGAELAKPKPVR